MLVPPTLPLMWEVYVIYCTEVTSQFTFGNFQLELIYFPTQQAGDRLCLDTPVDDPGTGV